MKLASLGRAILDGVARRPESATRDIDDHLRAAIDWLCVAQDVTGDGGVALRYSLLKGWTASYPETTGYIIPTFIRYASRYAAPEMRQRALRMADWELSIQNADGSFNGGPVGGDYGGFVFDTGQIIFGLLAAYRESGEQRYLDGAVRAGRWLTDVQEPGGEWRAHGYNTLAHVYYTRVAWALAELGTQVGEPRFVAAARRNADWALTRQRPNGWFAQAGFTERGHAAPYTHTISYTLEGLLETGARLDRPDYIDAVARATDAICGTIGPDGYWSGRFDHMWRPAANFACVTGSAQLAWVLARMYQLTGRTRYRDHARLLNRFVGARQWLEGAAEVRGAVPGSFPAWGSYQRFAYPNWAAKFFADALLLQREIEAPTAPAPSEMDTGAVVANPVRR